MTKFSGLIVSICLLLTACAHQKTQPDVQYDPATDARVRVYFGVATKFFFNTTCYPKHGGKAVTKPRVFNLANTTIGMPVPADAERYYDEYVVKGGQPLTTCLPLVDVERLGMSYLTPHMTVVRGHLCHKQAPITRLSPYRKNRGFDSSCAASI